MVRLVGISGRDDGAWDFVRFRLFEVLDDCGVAVCDGWIVQFSVVVVTQVVQSLVQGGSEVLVVVHAVFMIVRREVNSVRLVGYADVGFR